MKTLILAAGRFGTAMRDAIAEGREPRLDVFELARTLNADIIDYLDSDRSQHPGIRMIRQTLGASAAVAALGFLARNRYDAVLTTGEDIGLPYASLMMSRPTRSAHTMIAHTLLPMKKQVFVRWLRADRRIHHMLVYSTSEERLAKDVLHIPSERVQRIFYHADQTFFKPSGEPPEPRLICAAGQLLRDYDCLVEAVRGLDVQVQIAAGSPWIERPLKPTRELPNNVSWGKLSRLELRDLYARSALAVVPILENGYQTGIATILEMMAMGKCVIATRTQGQTDTIVDRETGVYVPPSDPVALRRAIEELLDNPEEAARIGRAARQFMEERAGLDLFVARVAQAVRSAHAALFDPRSRSSRSHFPPPPSVG